MTDEHAEVSDFRREYAKTMSEKEVQQLTLDMARKLGWRCFHTFDSRRSEPGFPDILAIHPEIGRVFVAELKRENKHPTPAQLRWLTYFDAVGIPTYVFRPSDWLGGVVERVLRLADAETDTMESYK